MTPRTVKETEGGYEVPCRESVEIERFPHALSALRLSDELFLLAQNKCGRVFCCLSVFSAGDLSEAFMDAEQGLYTSKPFYICTQTTYLSH